ncbi:MAG: F0F1 ATP synthase subunit A [Firmicutes bacterium]|nr:F0F1 ATP synthase subunit A [Bacillota bacterium]
MNGPRILFRVFGYPITETITNQWLVMVLIIALAYWVTRNLQKTPKGKQHIAELWVSTVQSLVQQAMGAKNMWFAPYIVALIPFIFFSNVLGLVGLRPPTADLNTTLALSMLTVFMFHYYSIKFNGIVAYLKGYLDPFALFLPINIIGELSRPVSLSFRLFGNLFGGSVIMSLVYFLLPVFLRVAVPIPFHIYFDIFSGGIQTFIFAMLTMVFIANAVGD